MLRLARSSKNRGTLRSAERLALALEQQGYNMTLQRSIPSVAAALLTVELGRSGMPRTPAAAGIDVSVLTCNVAKGWGYLRKAVIVPVVAPGIAARP